MPRTTRRSLSSAKNNETLEEQRQLQQDSSFEAVSIKATATATEMILSPNSCNMKKRTVSERSPAIKSRKKTTPVVPSNSTPNTKHQSPIRMDKDQVNSTVETEDQCDNKENRTPGPTPYWKIAEERGMSPRLTRSAKKNTSHGGGLDETLDLEETEEGVSRGLFQMEFSPPNPDEIRRLELQKERERDERLRLQRCQDGEVYFLSPTRKKHSSESNLKHRSESSSTHSGITINSSNLEELQVQLHDKDKENASLRAEKRMLESNLEKLQQKYDENFAKWEIDKQKLIVENAKLQGKLHAFHSPVLTDLKDFKNLEYRVQEMSQKLGEFNSERSKNRVDYEHGVRLEEMEQQITKLQSTLEKKEEEIKALTKEHQEALSAAMDKLKQYESNKVTLNDRVRKLEIEKNEALLRAHEAQTELEKINAIMLEKERVEEELRLQLSSVRDDGFERRNSEQEDEIRELCELTESQEREICRLQTEMESLEKQVSSLNDEKSMLEQEMSQAITALNEFKEDNHSLSSQIEMLKQESSNGDREIVSLKSKLEDKTLEYHNIQQELMQMTEKVKMFESECYKKDLAITDTKQDFTSRQQELLSQLQDARSCLQEKDNNFSMLLKKMTTFNERESELMKQILFLEEVRSSLHNKVIQLSGNIRVFVKVRPCIANEQAKAKDCETPLNFPHQSEFNSQDDLTKRFIVLTEPMKDRGGLSQRRKVMKFGFDNVFSPSTCQEDIWKATEPLVQSAVDGYNVCIFAYGQTGSGKTYTLLGGADGNQTGLIMKAVEKLFDAKRNLESVSQGTQFVEITVELLEIYNEQIRDLLSVKKDGSGYKSLNVSVNSGDTIGNVILNASNEEKVLNVLNLAQKLRCVKSTKSNEESSRSHLIFTMNFSVKNSSNVIVRKSKLHICDLAGSERLSKSQAIGSTLKETQHINKSLSTLSNVIEKLQQKSPHVPYRESKLTYILRNSLGGDSKTLAIVCCNPLAEHYQETSCSLKFAQKLSKVELKAMCNISC